MGQRKLTTRWQKSTRSGTGGDCVEARLADEGAQFRDSKDPDGAVLSFGLREFTAFVRAAAAGDFRPPTA